MATPRWLSLLVGVTCVHIGAPQITGSTVAVVIDENNTRIETTTDTFANLTQKVTSESCPNSVSPSTGLCTISIVFFYPIQGPCFFRQYRVRWLATNTDITLAPVITEITMTQTEVDGSTTVATADTIALANRNYPNTWSHPEFTQDSLNTSWFDPELRPMLLSFTGGASVTTMCFYFARSNPAVYLAVDGTMSADFPAWKVRIAPTAVTADACYTLDSNCDTNVDASVPSETFQFATPENFQMRENAIGSGVYVPVPCPQYGACKFNGDVGGACYDYGDGTLCAQCVFHGVNGATRNGTRLREGELCEQCPEPWVPWVKLAGFYVCWWVFVAGVSLIQYRAIKAPMFSPAAQAEAKYKEKQAEGYRKQLAKAEAEMKKGRAVTNVLNIQVDDEAEREAQEDKVTTLSPVLSAGLIRQVMEHHVLCCMAWEYSGLALCWPTSIRDMIFAVNMDWWSVLSMQCVVKTFFVDDAIWYGVVSNIVHPIMWTLGSYVIYYDFFGCTKTPEQKMLKSRHALVEAFRRLDKDQNGKLEVHEILKAVEPPEAFKRMPKPSTCVLSSFILWCFFQNPLYTRVWLTNLDCAELSGKRYLRNDLRVECTTDSFDYTLMFYASICCYVLFNIGTALASLLLILKARIDTKNSLNKEGEITCDSEAAYAFMLAGLGKGKWWFSSWKMLLKEILPMLILIDRSGTAPMDPGAGNAPAVLAIVGVTLSLIHGQINPFDRLYRFPLGTIERLSWIAFCAAPLAKLLIGNKVEIAIDKGTAYVGQWTKVAESYFEYSMIIAAGVTWVLPFLAAAYFIAGEELGFTKVHTINIEVAERIHVTLPARGSERRQLCKSLARLFEHAMLSLARISDDVECPTIAPASAIEGALLIVMREDASYWGDRHAGEHAVLNVEHESLLWAIGLLQRDRERKSMSLCRTIIDAGGLAETCLKQGLDINGLKVNLGDGAKAPHEEVSEEILIDTTVIFFCFALERMELRSAGFSEGKQEADQCRAGVLRALERGIGVAIACADQALDVRLTPVGLDRALVTVSVKCTDAADMQVREEYLRNSLGTKDSRNRWCKGIETDLARVGVTGSEGMSLMVRFSKGSKPQRTTDEGANKLMSVAIQSAASGSDKVATEYRREDPLVVDTIGKKNNVALDPDQDDLGPSNNEGHRLLNVNAAASKGRGRQIRVSELGEVDGARRRGAGKGRGKGKVHRAPNSMTSA